VARDSDGSARIKPRPGNRNLSLDPNRSSLRKVTPRRNVAPRSSLPSPSLPPPTPVRTERTEPSSVPRNRRLTRSVKRERVGPGAVARLRLGVIASARALVFGFVSRARLLATRLRGPSSALAMVLGLCVVVAAAVGLARFVQRHLTTSPVFAIQTIEVKGLTRVERSELLEAAGIDLGTNIFERSPDEVRARLLRHPWILSAAVERKLPSRFQILVHERQPVALLSVEACGVPGVRERDEARDGANDDASCDEPSSIYLVSEDARMFKRLSGKDPVDLPVITGVTRQRVASDPELSKRVLDRSVALMREYAKSGLNERHTIGEVHLEANDGISLYVGDDLTYVRLGAPPFEQKLRRMKKVFDRLTREQARAEYVYLDNEQRPDRVAVRLR
jgi:cell division protein FtsQ